MRKILTGLILLIAITSFAQKKTYQIGVLFDALNTNKEAYIHDRLQKEIKAVVGEDAHILLKKSDILENHYNLKKAQNNYQQLLKRCDIIIAFGMYDALALKQQKLFPKPTILVGDLLEEKSAKITELTTSGIPNLLYLSYSDNILNRLKTLKQLSDFKTVGIVIEKPITKIIDVKSRYDKILKGTGIQYQIIAYNSLDDIIQQLDDVDALDLENSFSLDSVEVKKLAQILIQKKIPSFSAVSRLDVKNGIMCSNISDDDLNRFFRRIALSVEKYVNGTNFSELPILIDFSNVIVVNHTTALKIGIPLRYSMLGRVEFIDNPKINPNAKEVYDLPHLISDVLDQNLTLKSQGRDVKISEQKIKDAKSNYLPEIKATATGVYLDPELAKISQGRNAEKTTSGNITLNQVLFSAQANANIKIQKSLAKAQKEQFNTKQLDAIFNAANAYFNVLILKTNVKIQANNLELTKKNLQIAEENYKAGQAGKTDLLRFRSQKAQNSQSLVEAINQLRKSLCYINQITNNSINEEIDVKEADLNDSIFNTYNYANFMDLVNTPSLRQQFTNFLVKEAINNAPEIKQLAHSMKAIEYQTKLYGSGRFLPQVALQGQYNYQFSRSGKGSSYPLGYPTPPDGNYNIGVSVTIPIFNRNSNRINRRTALLQKEQLNINTDNFKTAVALNINNSILNLINEISNIELSKVSEKSAKEALELTQNAYVTGAVNIVQLIDAQNNYIATQQAKTNATYNYLIQMLQLERYLGNYFLLNTKDEIAAFNRRFLMFVNEKK